MCKGTHNISCHIHLLQSKNINSHVCTHSETRRITALQLEKHTCKQACCKFLRFTFSISAEGVKIPHKINHRRLYLCTYANQTNSLKIELDVSACLIHANVYSCVAMRLKKALEYTTHQIEYGWRSGMENMDGEVSVCLFALLTLVATAVNAVMICLLFLLISFSFITSRIPVIIRWLQS